ncbi:MAG: hypothetical protein ABSD62_04080 [Candidatus Limnocylindrales bacterium]|jgi:hypothetical protein
MDPNLGRRSLLGRLAALVPVVGAKRRLAFRGLALALFVAVIGQWSAPPTAGAATSWRFDMYDATGVRYQDPDRTACVATSTQMMLNMISAKSEQEFSLRAFSLGDRFVPPSSPVLSWRPSISYETQEAVLAYDRANMTMLPTSAGTDAHGWRNGLNYFGWGSIDSGFYADRAFTSFDAAAKAVVHSVAVYQKPAGILAWYGGHAQFVTGYIVTGADPRTGSMAFTLTGVYLTDPLRSQAMRDKWLSYGTWRNSLPRIAFKQYWQKDSPLVDRLDGKSGTAEWYGRWVAVLPIR